VATNLAKARQIKTRRLARIAREESDFYPFAGGLNLIDSPLSSDPGQVQSALNYEMGFEGGYKRIGGYEGFDGRPSDSEPDYYRLPVALTKKPSYEYTQIVNADWLWPLDQQLIHGDSSGSLGLLLGTQQGGGFGTNVLLHNTTYDLTEWDLSAGSGVLSIEEQKRYRWDEDNAIIDALNTVEVTNAVATWMMEALNDPIAVIVGDILYVSMIARHLGHSATGSLDGLTMTIQNAVGDPFGLPSSVPEVTYDVERGNVISSSDHFDAVGVEVLSDKVMRFWARTKICSTADASMTIRWQFLERDFLTGNMLTSFAGSFNKMYIGLATAVVLDVHENPMNYVNGRTITDTNRYVGTNLTVLDADLAWASGVYADFSKLTEAASGDLINALVMADFTGNEDLYIHANKGDRLYIEAYVKFTAGQREGLYFTHASGSSSSNNNAARALNVGWDLENGINATLLNGSASFFPIDIEEQTIELLSADIYKVTCTFLPFIHDIEIRPQFQITATHAAGDIDDSYTHSSKYLHITGIRMMCMPNGGDEVQLGEVTTAETVKNVNTGYLILAGRTIGKGFELGENLTMWTQSMNASVQVDSQYETHERTVGVALGPQTLNDEPDATLDAEYTALATIMATGPTVDYGRATGGGIQSVGVPTPLIPEGSGPVRGLFYHEGFVFAARDTPDGAKGVMWKSSGVGWRDITVRMQAIVYDAGSGAEPVPGDEIEESGGQAIGLVIKVFTDSGTWGVDAVGTIWVKRDPDSGETHEWQNNGGLALTSGGGNFALVDGLVSPGDFQELPAGGRYEFRSHNFFGHVGRRRLYWVNGTGSGYEYNDLLEGWAPIPTGMTIDTPTHLAVHNSHLFFSFPGGSVQLSGDGDPFSWTVITGASEIGVGDEITGFNEEVGNSLFIFTRNQTFVLQGNTRANFDLDDFNINAGSHEWSLQRIGLGTYFDDRGFTTLLQTQRAGSVNFQENTQSALVQPMIEDLVRTTIVKCSHLIRKENIYRCYFQDGRVASIGFDGHEVSGHMLLQYPFVANVAVSEEAETGAERLFVGTDDGEIFEIEQGNSFDGGPVNSFIRTVLYHSKSPGLFKKYSHIRIDGTFTGALTLTGRVEYDFDDPDWNLGDELDFSSASAGGYWDSFVWDSFVWDRATSGNPQEKLEGEGTNVSIFLHSESSTDKAHTLRGATLQWMPRRDDRRV
jgi:hypothetical protein